MASDWSWLACGALIVANRNSQLYVVDGQHRLLAARRRVDITEIPCVVFETESIEQEAVGFLSVNSLRKPITGVDKFKAMIVAGDPAAILVNELCIQSGRVINRGSNAGTISCVNTLMTYATSSQDALERIWKLIVDLSHGFSMDLRIVHALMYIETHMPYGESLANPYWRSRFLKVGHGKIMDGIKQAGAFYKGGGAKIWASGVINAVNFRYNRELKLAEQKS